MASLNQLKLLGYHFLYKPGEGVFVYRDGTSGSSGLERLRKETKESIIAQGFPVETVDSLKEYSSLPGFGFAGGDVDTVAKVNQIASKFVEQLKIATSRTTEDDTKIGIGNRDFDRRTAEAIVGDKIPFSEVAVAEQYKAGEAATKAKDAEVAATRTLPGEPTQAERAGRIPTSIRDTGSAFEVVDARTGNAIQSVPYLDVRGNETLKLGDKNAILAQALAIQNQISTGGTPQLSGRPDLFAVAPTQAEVQAGIQPIVPQAGMAPVQPQVATQRDITALQQGKLATPKAEAAQIEQLKQQPIIEGQPSVDTTFGRQTTGQQQGGTAGGTPTDQVTTVLEGSVQNKEAAAVAADPSLQVTPEMRATWLQEALDELRQNRGIAEIIRNAEFDLGQSLNRLIEDVKFRELGTLNQFRQDFRNQQVSQRERGFLFGGIREQEEKQLADVTNLSLAQQGRGLERGIQDISQGFERTFGTTGSQVFGGGGALGVAPGLGSVQGVSRVIPGSPIIKAGQATPGFVISGGQFGSFNRELEEEARRRAQEKQNVFETQFSLARTF